MRRSTASLPLEKPPDPEDPGKRGIAPVGAHGGATAKMKRAECVPAGFAPGFPRRVSRAHSGQTVRQPRPPELPPTTAAVRISIDARFSLKPANTSNGTRSQAGIPLPRGNPVPRGHTLVLTRTTAHQSSVALCSF